MQCPLCKAPNSVDTDASELATGAVCCECGYMLEVTSASADAPPLTRKRPVPVEQQGRVLQQPGAKRSRISPQDLTLSQMHDQLSVTGQQQGGNVVVTAAVHASEGSAASALMTGRPSATDASGEFSSSRIPETGVFQSALNLNRPLHASKRGRESQPGRLAAPSNLRGSARGQRGINSVRSMIHSVIARLGDLPKKYDDVVFVMVNKHLNGQLRGGARTRALVGASIYFVARSEGRPFTLTDIGDAADLDAFSVGRAFSRLCRAIRETAALPVTEENGASSGVSTAALPVFDPAVLVPRIVDRLWQHTVDKTPGERRQTSSAAPVVSRHPRARVSLSLTSSDGTAPPRTASAATSNRSRFIPSELLDGASHADIHTHTWMQRCPYETKKELIEASMRVVAVAKECWVSTGRQPAPVAVAAVALAARLPVHAHEAKARRRTSKAGAQIPRQVRKKPQTESLDFLADSILAARGTALKRYIEVRAALLASCCATLPWGETVNVRNLDDHLPDLIVFESTNNLMRQQQKEEDEARERLDAGRQGSLANQIPSVRDTEGASSDLVDLSRSDLLVPAIEEQKSEKSTADAGKSGVPAVSHILPQSFRRTARARDDRESRVARGVERMRGLMLEEESLDDDDRAIDTLLRLGWSQNDLLDSTVSLQKTAAAAELQHSRGRFVMPLLLLPKEEDVLEPQSESVEDSQDDDIAEDDDDDEALLDAVLSPSELSDYIRSDPEYQLLRKLWDARLK